MKMKKMLAIVAVLGVAVVAWRMLQTEQTPTLVFPEPALGKAFLSATWGMSPAEVEEANQSNLSPSANPHKYVPIATDLRYEVLEEPRDFLGRRATVSYLFFENKLYSYRVFIEDRDAVSLDKETRAYLDQAFGDGYNTEEGPLKRIWNRKDVIVNYWFFKNELSLGEKYAAGYGVTSRSMDELIASKAPKESRQF
jgi:hypothetical protein